MKRKDLHGLMEQLLPVGKRIFLSGSILEYPYKQITEGVDLPGVHSVRRMTAVDQTSFRWYEPAEQLQMVKFLGQYFASQRSILLRELPLCTTDTQLNELSERTRESMLPEYQKFPFVKRHKDESFNRTRCLVDLYFEHLVAMAEELASSRSQLVPLLFLPLTSPIIETGIFSTDELRGAGITASSSFGDLKSAAGYAKLQAAANEKAMDFGQSFHRIYFDLMWKGKDKNRRYQEKGFNLFEVS